MTILHAPAPVSRASKQKWDIDRFFSEQGIISEEDYLRLTESTTRLVEFTDGNLEVLPMPSRTHPKLLMFLCAILSEWASKHDGGEVLVAAFPVRLRPGKIREPDVLYMRRKNLSRSGEHMWDRADLVMEIVSPAGRRRDLVEKRKDYAEGKIPEYWIVDPQVQSVTVLKLQGGKYVVHSQAAKFGAVESAILKGFKVDVSTMFATVARKS
jgi:Uma2 family endonuclease